MGYRCYGLPEQACHRQLWALQVRVKPAAQLVMQLMLGTPLPARHCQLHVCSLWGIGGLAVLSVASSGQHVANTTARLAPVPSPSAALTEKSVRCKQVAAAIMWND